MNEDSLKAVLRQVGVIFPPHVRPSNGWIHTHCPFAEWTHSKGTDSSPSFAVKIEDAGISAYKCMGCHKHGRISSMIRALESYRGQDYSELAMQADNADLQSLVDLHSFDADRTPQKPEPLDESLYVGVFEEIKHHPDALAYMQLRGIGDAAIQKAGIVYDPDKKRIVFPVRGLDGALYGWSGRTILPDHTPKVLDYSGLPKRWLLLGQELWQPDRKVLIVEGLFTHAHMLEIGMDSEVNVGALLGSFLTPEKADLLLEFGQPVVLLLDDDDAGDVGLFGQTSTSGEVTGGAISQLAPFIPVQVPAYPEDVDDPDNLTKRQVQSMCTDTPAWV